MAIECVRWHKETLKDALESRRVIVISGSRQCGKTTLAKQIIKDLGDNTIFRTLDNPDFLKLALEDPLNFVRHSKKTMIIDEAQRAPELLPAIKMIVDENPAYGQFLLTGSADIQSLPAVRESLAGRVKNIYLKPLTQGEILSVKPSFIKKCLSMDFPDIIKGFDKKDLINKAFIGGYPEAVFSKPKNRKDWHRDYISAMLARDLKEILNISRQDAIDKLFKILCAWSAKFIDWTTIGANLEISANTLKSYVNVLKTLCLFEGVPAWIETDYERAVRKEKIFAADCGFMTSILDWEQDDIFLDSDKSGKLIETFVYNELAAQISLNSDYNLYHYRDREKREIDFLINAPKDTVIAIEVKAGESADLSDFKHIQWFRQNLAADKTVIGIILYSGEQTLAYKKNNFIVPISLLWN
ncbi:MAG: ATP-binding protein [Elusimicrobiota bacterium]|jgi:predicted AAA+ superfamily ATPase|nr:ATP-binding protein [Elusimicrobiota bacterium]